MTVKLAPLELAKLTTLMTTPDALRLLECAGLGVLLVDARQHLLAAGGQARTLWGDGLYLNQPLDLRALMGCPDWVQERLLQAMRQSQEVLIGWREWVGAGLETLRPAALKAMDVRGMPLNASSLNESEAELATYAILVQDRREDALQELRLREMELELEQANQLDRVTGLLNRAHWESRFGLEFQRCKRYGEPMSLVCLELPELASIQERFGMHASLELLRESGREIGALLRASDLAGRLGDNLIALMLTQTELAGAGDVAQRVEAIVRSLMIRVAGQRIPVHAHAVAVTLKDTDQRYDDLLRQADDALFEYRR